MPTQYRRGGGTPEEIAPIQSPQCSRTAGIRACTWRSAVVHTSNHIPPGLALAGPPWKRRHTHAANHDCTERARVKGPAVRLGTRRVSRAWLCLLLRVALCASRTEWEDRPCSSEIPPLLGGGLLRELDSVSLLRSNPSNHEMARGIIVNRRHTLLDVDLSSPSKSPKQSKAKQSIAPVSEVPLRRSPSH